MHLTSLTLDFIPWVGIAFALLMACELVHETVVWVRGFSGKPRPPSYRRVAEVPQVATGQADNVSGVR